MFITMWGEGGGTEYLGIFVPQRGHLFLVGDKFYYTRIFCPGGQNILGLLSGGQQILSGGTHLGGDRISSYTSTGSVDTAYFTVSYNYTFVWYISESVKI